MPRPRTGQVRQCLECAKEMYLPPSQIARRKYCSYECQSLAVERRQRRFCVRCGKEFGQSPSIGAKYCSRACYEAERRTRETCAVCDHPLLKNQALYCSPLCRAQGRVTLEIRPCEVCNTPMQVQPHQFGKKRVCSRRCNDELKRLDGPGARIKRHDGYMQIYYPKHPDASRSGFVLEHRLVAEQKYGRRVLPGEHVHHINHDRADNRPENLEIISASDHARESIAYGKQRRAALRARVAELDAEIAQLRAQEKEIRE